MKPTELLQQMQGDVRTRLRADLREALAHNGYLPAIQQMPMVEGDSCAQHIAPLVRLARAHGFPVFYRPFAVCQARDYHGMTQFACAGLRDADKQQIIIADGPEVAPNHKFRVLTHEVGHALMGAHHTFELACGPEEFRARAEVVAESVSMLVCASVGLDIYPTSLSYIAQQPFATNCLADHAALIESIVREQLEVIHAAQVS